MSEPQACNFIKKETVEKLFSCEFCKNVKNTFVIEYLWAIAFVYMNKQLNSFVLLKSLPGKPKEEVASEASKWGGWVNKYNWLNMLGFYYGKEGTAFCKT